MFGLEQREELYHTELFYDGRPLEAQMVFDVLDGHLIPLYGNIFQFKKQVDFYFC